MHVTVRFGATVEAFTMIFKATRLGDAVHARVGVVSLNQLEDRGPRPAKGEIGKTRAMRSDHDARVPEQADLFPDRK